MEDDRDDRNVNIEFRNNEIEPLHSHQEKSLLLLFDIIVSVTKPLYGGA